jgi:DNA repair exonuclease SbcCD ATPase subunit
MTSDEIESLQQRAQLYASKNAAGMYIEPHNLLNIIEDFRLLQEQLEDAESQLLNQSDLENRAGESDELEKDLANAEKQVDDLTLTVEDLERDNKVLSKALANCHCYSGEA